MRIVHILKCLPEYFGPLIEGRKTFEVRLNDRNFQEGDVLDLREWSGEDFTGDMTARRVLYVLREFPGLAPGYVCLGLGTV